MGKVANGLGAAAVEPLNPKGLEVILNIALDMKPHRVGCFPFECLDGYDLDKKKVILTRDYSVWRELGSDTLFFLSAAPNKPMIFLHKSRIVSIKRLSDNTALY